MCLTLCDPMDCSSPGSSIHGDSPGKSTGVGCHAFLQGIFLTQGLNPFSWVAWRQILYHLRHQGRDTKKYCYELWKTVLTLFSCRIFTVSGLIFRSLKHFLSLFLYMVWGNVLISFFYIFGGDLFTKSCPILVIPWTIAHQVPLSMRFSRQEYWSGLSLPSPGDLPNPRIEPGSPALQADSLLA